MDGELLRALYHLLFHDPNLSHLRSTRNCTYCDGLILFIFFYAVFTNRSPRWASDKRNWPLWCRHIRFPSYSQLMKRLSTAATQQQMDLINRLLRLQLPRTFQKNCDGKPLIVGGFSKDPDARLGKVPDGWARGYKLHAISDFAGPFDATRVTALDAGEPTVAQTLVRSLAPKGLKGLNQMILRGDSNYDSNRLYRTVEQCGGRLIAPRKKPGRGLGHHPQHPHRLWAIRELEDPMSSSALEHHRLLRNRIEQSFAHLTNLSFGLWALPNFVRRLPRVRQWVLAKILLYHLHLLRLQQSRTG